MMLETSKGPQLVTVLRENPKTLLVRLPDGNVILRHKKKHKAKTLADLFPN